MAVGGRERPEPAPGGRPEDSQFEVTVCPPPGQPGHTVTPACQRRAQQDVSRGRTERVFSRRKQRERVLFQIKYKPRHTAMKQNNY